jgi:uncharacterized membrane protein
VSNKKSKKDIVLRKKSEQSSSKKAIIAGVAAGIVAVAAIIVIILVTGDRGTATVLTEGIEQSGNEIVFDAGLFADGKAKYFEQTFSNRTVRYFLVQSRDGVVRAAFDACDVCFGARRGYRQEGNLMVCNNCGQVFPADRINIEKGGCNPAPLKREARGNVIAINIGDIQKGLRFF